VVDYELEYRTRNFQVAVESHRRSFASNLRQVATLGRLIKLSTLSEMGWAIISSLWTTGVMAVVIGVFRIWQSGHGPWRARRARAYNGSLGAEPPAESRSRAPGRGVRGRSLPEAETLFAFERSMEVANSPIFSEIWKRRKSQRHIRCNLTWRF